MLDKIEPKHLQHKNKGERHECRHLHDYECKEISTPHHEDWRLLQLMMTLEHMLKGGNDPKLLPLEPLFEMVCYL